jgi:hypothetical protein
MIVTCTTVGYGDISPKTDWGRFAAMAMISFAIITVPQMTNELIEKMSQLSIYARARYIPKTRKSAHILVCGDCGASTSLREFFLELFHEDHDVSELHAVVLHPGYPNAEMRSILKDPQYIQNLTYLDGSPLSDNDLHRALASRCQAVFLFANKFTNDADEEDAKTILQQFSIQRHLNLNRHHSSNHSAGKDSFRDNYDHSHSSSKPTHSFYTGRDSLEDHYGTSMGKKVLSSRCASVATGVLSLATSVVTGGSPIGLGDWDDVDQPPTAFCIQLIRPDNKRHLAAAGSHSLSSSAMEENPQHIVCLNEIKMGVIAKACVFPVSASVGDLVMLRM